MNNKEEDFIKDFDEDEKYVEIHKLDNDLRIQMCYIDFENESSKLIIANEIYKQTKEREEQIKYVSIGIQTDKYVSIGIQTDTNFIENK